jgi:hypothetical protein
MNPTRLLFLLALLLFAHAGTAQAPLSSGYYVVVAAYKNTGEGYAKRYTDGLKAKGHDAHYGLSKSGKLYLVYVHYDNDRNESLTEMKGERKKGEFPDAWVRVVKGDQPQPEVAKAETDKSAAPPTAEKNTPPAAVVAAPVVEAAPEKVSESAPPAVSRSGTCHPS